MPRLILSIAGVAACLIALLVAVPVSAATTGTLCGQVTAFTAPTIATDGSITINGTTEVIDNGASGSIDAATLATLTAAAIVDARICLDVTANSAGAIVDLAASAKVCGDVVLEGDGDANVGGTTIPASMIDAEARSVLQAAVSANADACAEVGARAANGSVSVTVSVTAHVCLEVTALSDSSIGLGGSTFALAGGSDASLEVGDVVCATLAAGPSGPASAVLGSGVLGAGGGAGGAGGAGLPDTATEPIRLEQAAAPLFAVLLGAGATLEVLRRRAIGLR